MTKNYSVDGTMLEERASSFGNRSIKKESKKIAIELAVSMIDLTTLEGADSAYKVKALCEKGKKPLSRKVSTLSSVAAICVYPTMVKTAKKSLENTQIKVATVATGFPSAQYPLEVRLEDLQKSLNAGADEVDMVISRGLFLAGKHNRIQEEVNAVKSITGNKPLKIILETGEIGTYDNIKLLSELVLSAAEPKKDGDVFLKTSTGKVTPAATPASTLLLMEVARDFWITSGIKVGIKPAGGIKTSKQALAYLVMLKETLGESWLTPKLFRFGASSLLNDLIRQYVWICENQYAAPWDVSEG